MISSIFDRFQSPNQAISHYKISVKDTTAFLSPTLPMNFDRSLIPQNICEDQFLLLTQCLNNTDPGFWEEENKNCSNFVFRFQKCKEKRDIILYDRIKTWEIDRFKSLTPQNKQLYLQGLTFKLQRLKEDFKSLPSVSSTQFLEKKVAHEEAQVRWRLRYLEKL